MREGYGGGAVMGRWEWLDEGGVWWWGSDGGDGSGLMREGYGGGAVMREMGVA